MADVLSDWVNVAARLPVAFAQVREDPLLDLLVTERLGPRARVMLVASGGCTAALLAAAARNVVLLHLVDPNPAQLALAELKLRLLETADLPRRSVILGHSDPGAADRRAMLAAELEAIGRPETALGPMDEIARLGPDYAGRYERVFAALHERLRDCSAEIQALLQSSDPADQQIRVAEDAPLGRRIDEALDCIMGLPNLVRLFGSEATQNPVEPFSRHFARRIRHALAALPARDNPFLWQMLVGRFPPGRPAEWLTRPAPARMPAIEWSRTFMNEALEAAPASFDYVQLSNILDWLSPDQATETLTLANRALRPGGYTLVRQLNSTLNIPRLGAMFDWQTDEAEGLHCRDRSFFYRHLHLGRKR